jgi:hypothetical protein
MTRHLKHNETVELLLLAFVFLVFLVSPSEKKKETRWVAAKYRKKMNDS